MPRLTTLQAALYIHYTPVASPTSPKFVGQAVVPQLAMGDVADLTAKAYEIVRLIPPGHVTTYGHIAKLAGYPTYSR